MKRFFAFMMALAMLFSMSVNAFATEDKGSITVTNATVGDTYYLYKIFDAAFAVGEDGKPVVNNDKVLVSYTIEEDNQFFSYMFSEENAYFSYNANTGAVTRKEGTSDSAITDYLKEMVQDETKGYTPVTDPIEAVGETVVFDDLSYGYYLIDKGNGAAVTITSNTPDVKVIDKTQIPANKFDKWIWDEDINEGNGGWVKNTSSNIGDIVNYKVEFSATNFDGEYLIKYYTVKDTKGDALWVEFDDIIVTVQVPDGHDENGNVLYNKAENDIKLTKGYYHCANPEVATGEWEYIGTGWGDIDTENKPDCDEAEWYLIHHGYDDFDIVIPWMEDHHFTGTTNGFDLTYAEGAASKYDSPVNVVIQYSASVEPNAKIGADGDNLWNKAKLTWTSKTTGGPDEPSGTNTIVYALGLNKIDAATSDYLAGAVFEIYRDKDCTEPVHVIPTNIKGVYILDDLYTDVSGENRETSREKYAAYLSDYLNGATQKNVVTTEVNGKIVVLGLEAGKYYLKETKAPDGYNILSIPEVIEVGTTNKTFFVVADENGQVYNKQSADEDGYKVHNYTVTETTVKNSKGIELPSTGGEGTMMLITIGTMIAMAFAVLLITHKKMSIYHD